MSVVQLVNSQFQSFISPAQGFYQQVKEDGLRSGTWNYFFEKSAPTTRNFDVAYVPLQRKDGGHLVDVGSFIPEYHVMAEAGMLPRQIKAQKFLDGLDDSITDKNALLKLKEEMPGTYKALYHADGTPKSSFELSIIPFYEHDKLQRVLSKTYSWLKDRGYPWPHPISKIRVGDDYLARLEESSLSIKNDNDAPNAYQPTSGIRSTGIQSVFLSVKNQHQHATVREKVFHTVGPWLAWLVTLTATLSVLGIASWAMLAAAAVGTYIAVNCANQFDMFDKAESFYRDLGWILSEKYPTVGKLSRTNLAKTVVKAAALSFIAWSAGVAAGSALLGLPFLEWAPAVEAGLAVFFGTIAAVGSFVGLSGAMRYIDGFSISDNQIDINPEEAKGLKVVVESETKRAEAVSAMKKVVKQGLEPGQTVDLDDLLSPQGRAFFSLERGDVIITHKVKASNDYSDDEADLSSTKKFKTQ